MVLEVDGGTVVGARGDREHPISRGYLCPKGVKNSGELNPYVTAPNDHQTLWELLQFKDVIGGENPRQL